MKDHDVTQAYDERLSVLYAAPLANFVAERKRLAAELKSSGQSELAARFSRLLRPSLSAWAVNQLWWCERSLFERLIAAAARLGRGEREATREHRDLLAQLRERAAQLLEAGGHAASDGTMRRLGVTLSAVAADGGFSPDPEGALSADRDPPGFGSAFAFVEAGAARVAAPAPVPATKQASATAAKLQPAPSEREGRERAKQAEFERVKQAELERAAELERIERERLAEQRAAERKRIERALGEARSEAAAGARMIEKLRVTLAQSEKRQRQTFETIEQLEGALLALAATT